MQLHFFKYQGTGNDFIIIDNRNKQYQLTTEQINFLCNRRLGIGADGLMLLEEQAGYDFKMVYYNADGNEGTMCGNGGRCLVKFAKDRGIVKPNYTFIAIDGEHKANFDDNGWIQLKMQDVPSYTENKYGDVEINTGSPHYIRNVNDVLSVDVFKEGQAIRYNETYEAKGINVNFVQRLDENTIAVRTYERGVEDETLSCGTGVTASALVFAHNERGFNHVDVKTKGGLLAVEFNKTADTAFENIWLCGPATFVFEGKIEI